MYYQRNKTIFVKTEGCIKDNKIKGRNKQNKLASAKKQFRLASELHLWVGARVMLLHNIDIEDGFVNGAFVTVTKIVH